MTYGCSSVHGGIQKNYSLSVNSRAEEVNIVQNYFFNQCTDLILFKQQ